MSLARPMASTSGSKMQAAASTWQRWRVRPVSASSVCRSGYARFTARCTSTPLHRGGRESTRGCPLWCWPPIATRSRDDPKRSEALTRRHVRARAARLFGVATGRRGLAAVNVIGSYDYALVALSVLIAMLASYAALDLASRVTASGGWTRWAWLLGGAAAMGTGIWSMHYIGMLAFVLPVPVAYHWPTVLLSLCAAILASVVALYVVSRQKMGALRACTGSVLMGAGIASMHYLGMAAMRVSAMCQFSSVLVVLSVVFAVLV